MTTDTTAEIQKTIFEALESFGAEPDAITREATFEELDIDSLDVAELAQITEDKWNVKMSTDDLAGISTVGDVLDLIAERA
jgi:acyl carrier protein